MHNRHTTTYTHQYQSYASGMLMNYVGCVMVSARVRHARSRCGPKVRPGGARPTHWCGRVGKKLCGELRFPWRALCRERCGLQSQVSRRLAFELACSNTPSRVAGAVAFGRMLAYAALRLPTTSTGTYGTGVLAKSVYADIPVLVGRHRYIPGPALGRAAAVPYALPNLQYPYRAHAL